MFERSLDILKAFVSIFILSSDSQTLKFPLLNSLLNKTKMIEDEYVSQLAERIRRQRIASSSKPVLPLLLHSSSSSSSSSLNNQNQNRKLDVLKWRREKELNSKQEKETRMKREQEQTKAAKEKERKDRKARKARISEREEERKRRNSERERNSSLEAMKSKNSHKICSPLEALARRRRDMDFARHRYEMKTKEAKEKEEREARIARAAEKFRPKVFGSSVLRAETICSRERMKARADANEAARAKAESWFLPMNSVIK
jgi:membrane protein involved in colicin uptake